MKRSALLAPLLLIALAGTARPALAGEGLALVRPSASAHALKVTRIDRQSGSMAEFKGRVRITGLFIAQWLTGVDEESDNTLDVRLVPDSASAAALPFFQGYAVHKIDVANEDRVLLQVFGTKVLARLRRKELKYVGASGSFWIEGYVVGVDCDTSWARASMTPVRIAKPLQLAGERFPVAC